MEKQNLESMIQALMNIESVHLDVHATIYSQIDDSFTENEKAYITDLFGKMNDAICALVDLLDNKLSTSVSLKASQVMDMLGITRVTLSKYVKQGLVKTDSCINGRYRYNAESVYNLLNKGNKDNE